MASNISSVSLEEVSDYRAQTHPDENDSHACEAMLADAETSHLSHKTWNFRTARIKNMQNDRWHPGYAFRIHACGATLTFPRQRPRIHESKDCMTLVGGRVGCIAQIFMPDHPVSKQGPTLPLPCIYGMNIRQKYNQNDKRT
jgi:hypothetical protein